MNYLLDTNAIIYLLKGKFKPLPFTDTDNILISFITKIELLSYEATPHEEEKIEKLLNYYDIRFIENDLISKIIDIRKNYRIKIPDAIIIATALQENATLITSDQKIIKKASEMNIKILDPLSGETKL